MTAVPSVSLNIGVRAALLRFFAAQRIHISQDQAETIFERAGYERATVRQAMYDMSSVKVGTLDRNDAGLAINAKGREALAS